VDRLPCSSVTISSASALAAQLIPHRVSWRGAGASAVGARTHTPRAPHHPASPAPDPQGVKVSPIRGRGRAGPAAPAGLLPGRGRACRGRACSTRRRARHWGPARHLRHCGLLWRHRRDALRCPPGLLPSRARCAASPEPPGLRRGQHRGGALGGELRRAHPALAWVAAPSAPWQRRRLR